MRSQDKPDEQGFTLVEIMVATAVTSVIVVGGMSALTRPAKPCGPMDNSECPTERAYAMERSPRHQMAGFGASH